MTPEQKEKFIIAKKILKESNMPDIPKDILDLKEKLSIPALVNINEVSEIIEKNTRLSGAVLELLNDKRLKLNPTGEPISSISSGIRLVGIENISSLILPAALKNLNQKNTLYTDIMNFSMDVAFCMADISEWVYGVTKEKAYMIGIFHDVGALALASYSEERYENLYIQSQGFGNRIIDFEEQEFYTDHSYIGTLIARKWGLPNDVINTIYLHHSGDFKKIEDDNIRGLVAMVRLSSSIVSEISLGAYFTSQSKKIEQEAIEELSIKKEIVDEIRMALTSYSYKME